MKPIVVFSRLTLSLALFAALAQTAFAQSTPAGPPQDPDQFLMARVTQILKRAIQMGDLGKDSALPSVLQTSSTLVDRGAFDDVVSTEFGYGPLSSRQETRAFSTAVAISAYAMRSAAAGVDPLETDFYNDNSRWRDLGISIAITKPEGDPQQTTANVRFRYLNLRDPRHNDEAFATIQQSLGITGSAYLDVKLRARRYFEEVYPEKDLASALAAATPRDLEFLDFLIESRIHDFYAVSESSMQALRRIQKRPQFAISVSNTKVGEGGPNALTISHVMDFGLIPGVNATLNAGYTRLNQTGVDLNGATAAAALRTRVRAMTSHFIGLELSSRARWRESSLPVYSVQGTVDLPFVDGLRLPLSVVYTNRVGPLNESQVKAQMSLAFNPIAFGAWLQRLGSKD